MFRSSNGFHRRPSMVQGVRGSPSMKFTVQKSPIILFRYFEEASLRIPDRTGVQSIHQIAAVFYPAQSYACSPAFSGGAAYNAPPFITVNFAMATAFQSIPAHTLSHIIDLAERRATATQGGMPPPPEKQALRDAINLLSETAAKELCALLYLGRDGLDGIQVDKVIAVQLDEVAPKSRQEITQELMADLSLADDLLAGLELIANPAN